MTKKKKVSTAALVQAVSRMAISAQPSKPKSAKRKKRKRTSPVSSEGMITLSRTEYLTAVSVGTGGRAVGHVDLVPDSFGFLKTFAKAFERLRWDSLEVYYKPAVGSTVGGLVAVGVDWDWIGSDVERVQINSYTPNFTLAVSGDNERSPMRLPKDRLQSTLWYTPNSQVGSYQLRGPGKLHWAVTSTNSATTFGELYVKYRVTMMGTCPA